jgi:plasmid stability protein
MANNQNQNMTITADEDVLRWLRVRAAERRTSASRLAGEILRERMQRERGYFSARRRYLSVKARVISRGPYPGREELHNR